MKEDHWVEAINERMKMEGKHPCLDMLKFGIHKCYEIKPDAHEEKYEAKTACSCSLYFLLLNRASMIMIYGSDEVSRVCNAANEIQLSQVTKINLCKHNDYKIYIM